MSELSIIKKNNIYILVKDNTALNVYKYVVYPSMMMIDFINVLREKIGLSSYETFVLFVGGKMINCSFTTMGLIYNLYKNRDDVIDLTLYVVNTLG